jgi:hypothetical protein
MLPLNLLQQILACFVSRQFAVIRANSRQKKEKAFYDWIKFNGWTATGGMPVPRDAHFDLFRAISTCFDQKKK